MNWNIWSLIANTTSVNYNSKNQNAKVTTVKEFNTPFKAFEPKQ